MNNTNLGDVLQVVQLFEFKKVLIFLFGVLILYIVNKSLDGIGRKFGQRLPTKRLLILQITTIMVFLIYIVGVVVLFYRALQPSSELIFALGGSIAVAMGLALKDIVSSLVAGVILLFDQPFQVGDRVSFDGQYGDIKSIGLRTVRLNTLDDNMVTIPNSRFLTDIVSSGNAGESTMMVVVKFYVAPDCDLRIVKKITTEAIIISKYSYLKKPHAIIASEINLNGALALEIQVKSYVFDIKYEKAFQTDVVLKVEEWFLEHAIKRPSFNMNGA